MLQFLNLWLRKTQHIRCHTAPAIQEALNNGNIERMDRSRKRWEPQLKQTKEEADYEPTTQWAVGFKLLPESKTGPGKLDWKNKTGNRTASNTTLSTQQSTDWTNILRSREKPYKITMREDRAVAGSNNCSRCQTFVAWHEYFWTSREYLLAVDR